MSERPEATVPFYPWADVDSDDLQKYLREAVRWQTRHGSAANGEIEIIVDPVEAREALLTVRTRAFHKRLQGGDSTAVASRLAREETGIGIVFEDRYMGIFRDLCRFPAGFTGTYEHHYWTMNKGTGICVAPITNVGLLVLSDAYHYALRARTLEFPRGGLHEEEVRVQEDGTLEALPIRSVRDEVYTETGYEIDPAEVKHLGEVDPDSGLSTQTVQLFAATASHLGPPKPDVTEAIFGAVELTRQELEQALLRGYYEYPSGSGAYAGTRVRMRGAFELAMFQALRMHGLI